MSSAYNPKTLELLTDITIHWCVIIHAVFPDNGSYETVETGERNPDREHASSSVP